MSPAVRRAIGVAIFVVRRTAVPIAGVAVLIVAFVLLSGGQDESRTPAASTIRVVDAKPQGGLAKLQFKQGDEVRFRVVSDTADEIHVHGYDIHKDVAQGGSVTFAFPGKIEGRFVVELEGKGEQIAQLDVVP